MPVTLQQARDAASTLRNTRDKQARKEAARVLASWQVQEGKGKRLRR